MTTNITELADGYFSTINPIAAKIKLDISEVAGAYEHLWNRFSCLEQNDVINETLIRPELVLRYFDQLRSSSPQTQEDEHNGHLYDLKHISTYVKQRTGLKCIQDDVCGVYRDEHSPPFAMKTKSQIALNLFERYDGTNSADITVTPVHSTIVVPESTETVPVISVLKASPAITSSIPPLEAVIVPESPDSSIASKPTSYYDLSSKDSEALPLLQFSKQPQIQHQHHPPAGRGNFLTKFITGTVNSSGPSGGIRPEDEQRLVANMAASAGLNSSSSGGEDDEKQNFNEFNTLLEQHDLKKGYDFLNNW